MEGRDQQRLNLKELVNKLRAVTLAVQIIPFIYTAIYLLSMAFYWFADESVIAVIDELFYTSSATILAFLILSKALRLCVWHKIACALPLIPQMLVILDGSLVTFSISIAKVSILIMSAMCLLLLVAAYKVFFTNGR